MSNPKCPICGKPTEQQWRPFCSRRCADVDLHRWLSDVYVVPGDDATKPQAGTGGEDDDL